MQTGLYAERSRCRLNCMGSPKFSIPGFHPWVEEARLSPYKHALSHMG